MTAQPKKFDQADLPTLGKLLDFYSYIIETMSPEPSIGEEIAVDMALGAIDVVKKIVESIEEQV